MEENDQNEVGEGLQAQGVAKRQDWVKEMRAKKHVQGTDGAYAGKILSLIEFLRKAYPDLLRERFKTAYDALSKEKRRGEKSRRELVVESIEQLDKNRIEATGILHMEQITEDVVLQWFAEFKGKKDTTPSRSVFGTAQSALVDLYKRHGVPFPREFYGGMGDVKKGAQRKRAQEKVEGKVPIEEGKAAIPGHLYLELVEALLKSPVDVFCHTFAVCCWVLMCRVSNVAELRGAHFCWENDSIVISMVKHKADQEGLRTDPKHCYANPFKPSACVVLALAIYFAVYGPPKSMNDKVFEGNRQHDRFVEAVRRVLEQNPRLKAEMDRLGITAEDIAAHSFRKGGRSYAQGGTTGGPSTPSILMRGLWALEGMDKKYVRYEAAADQFIGRILAMLDILSPDFAALCPHFDIVDEVVMAAMQQCFPGAPKQLEGVLLNCLASLVYHRAYLRDNLAKTHPLFKAMVFTQGFMDSLAGRVALAFPHDKITPTGVPPHVTIQRDVREVKQMLEGLPGAVRTAVKTELEERAVDAGSITRSALEGIIEATMGRLQAALKGQLLQQQLPPQQPEALAVDGEFQMWMVGGTMRRVPQDFKFDTQLPARTLFQLYCLGDRNAHIGPYRNLETKDFVTKNEKSRHSDMMALMRPVEAALKQQQRWEARPTLDQVNDNWERVHGVVAVAERTDKNRRRRMKQLAWTTQLGHYRKRGREEREEEGSSDERE
jgi:hypothetical protein